MSGNPSLHPRGRDAGSPEPAGTKPPATGRRSPPWPVWLILVLCAVALVLLRGFADVESANRNIATFVLGMIASITLLTWFVLRSGYRRGVRWSALAAVAAGVAVAASLLRIDQFDGALVPTFAWRWQAPRDQLLPAAHAAVTEPLTDLVADSLHDFPQFLGPNRDATLPDVELSQDWTAHPPESVWREPIGAGWSAFALTGPYAITLEQRGPDELVTCYRIATGELVWVQSTPARHENILGGIGPRSTPTVYEGRVYALGATGWLHCLDGASGRVLWDKNLIAEFGIASAEADTSNVAWGRSASPLIVDHLVIVPAGGPTGGPFTSLVAYDVTTGQEAWRSGTEQISYASPGLYTLLGQPTIVIVNESSVTGHDPKTGKVLWHEAWPGSSNTSASTSQCVALDDHRLFVSKGYGEGCKLFEVSTSGEGDQRTWQTHDLWALPRHMQTKFSNVVLYKASIFGLSDGILECINAETGARRWKKGRYGHGQILLVGDTILVLGELGELALVAANPDRFEELGRIQALEGKTWNNLALSSPYLLIRNGEEAACYRLPLASQIRGESVDQQPADPPPAADGG
jgi:outer membrane protein assembly factor BamB